MINTRIVIAGAQGLVKSIDGSMLTEYGGPAALTRGWAKSLLQRMKFCRRMSTTQSKISPEHLKEKHVEFLQSIIDIVTIEEIPCRLIFNWDQNGLNLVPSANWTMEQK